MRAPSFLALLSIAWLCACGKTQLPPFGDLVTPVAVAIHQPSGQVFVASQGADELRVFDIPTNNFLRAPAISFPLSIPTVPTPRLLAAGGRFVFVLSGATGEVGFVDTMVPPGSFGPRSVDDPAGNPIVAIPPMTTFAMAPIVSVDGADAALLAGIDDLGGVGRLAVVRPPIDGSPPDVEGILDLPEGIVPTGLAIEQGFVPVGGPIPDCRGVAVADRGTGEGHVPGIWLTRALVEPDGSVSIAPLDPSDKIVVRVEVTLPDGATEERIAPVRAVEFAPVPRNVPLEEAVRADPCAQRSGRIFAVLDTSYCSGTVECPNFAAFDLPSRAFAVDEVTGNPAAYQLPATPLGALALLGPVSVLSRAGEKSVPARDPTTREPAVEIEDLVLVNSSDGGITYVSGGLGTRLLGPGTETRRGSDPVFLLSSEEAPPGLKGEIVRIDRRGVTLPRLDFPPDARPRNEEWTAGFEIPLPGFASVGVVENLQGNTLSVPERSGLNFLSPLPLVASGDPEAADRVVPLPVGTVRCDGFPISSIAADGKTLQLNREAPGFSNSPECLQGQAPLAILSPRSLPWTLQGTVSGFAGRIPADPDLESSVFFGSRLLFGFRPTAEPVERGATFTWTTTSGFAFFRQQRDLFLPASMAKYQVAAPNQWKVAVAYSGSDALLVYDPTLFASSDATVFR